MPPKKKTRTTAGAAAAAIPDTAPATTPRRSTRAKTLADAAGSPGAKRKRAPSTAQEPIELSDDGVELAPVRARGSRRGAAGRVRKEGWDRRTCEGWFAEYTEPESGEINGATLGRWVEDLGGDAEGVLMYFLLWRCGAESTMAITKEEFMRTMEAWKVDSNAKLMAKLKAGDFMYRLHPRAGDAPDDPEFLPFYKWCFNHFRVEQAKNITADVGTVLFETLLDPEKYQPDWKKGEEAEGRGEVGRPRLNHVQAFVEFLRNGPKPAAIVTRDQFEQFYHFNKQVSWNLAEYNELTSTWPTLMDEYVVWKKEKYPTE